MNSQQIKEQIKRVKGRYVEDETLCGKPENHNNGEIDNCLECRVIKENI